MGGGEEVGPRKQAEAKKFDGWATLKGRFVVEGTPPSEPKIHSRKDQAYCGEHPLANESVVVGTGNGLGQCGAVRAHAESAGQRRIQESAADKIVLDNKYCRFQPHVLGIRVGQTLTVKNSDQVAHNTKISGESLQFNQLIPVGTSLDLPIDSAESQPAGVACSIHDWMSGRLLIRPDPYFADHR